MKFNFIDTDRYPPRALASPSKKLVAYWTPKAGCSLMAKMFLIYIGNYDNHLSPIYQRDLYTQQQLKNHNERQYLCNQNDSFYEDYVKIQMVRNPYDRAVASFIKYLHIAKNRITLSFQSYLELILFGNSVIDPSEKTFIEHHFLPQYMTSKLDHVIKMENITQDLYELHKKYDILLKYTAQEVEPSYQTQFYNPEITHKCSCEQFRFTDNGLQNMNSKQIGVPRYELFYNQYCKNMVGKIYAKDIEYFDYDFPYKNLAL